jgi:hypothetical protein
MQKIVRLALAQQTGLWIKLRFLPTTFPKAEKNSLKGQKSLLSDNPQPVSLHWKAFGKVQTRFVQSPSRRNVPFSYSLALRMG